MNKDVEHVSSDLLVVCEASSNIAANLTPRGLRLLYGHYSKLVLWCGFNSAEQTTGSKAIVGNAQSLLVLGQCLQRLKLDHIDRTYKALRSDFFALAQRNHICFGVLRHRSQCCDTARGDDMPLSANEYVPKVKLIHYVSDKRLAKLIKTPEAISSKAESWDEIYNILKNDLA